MKLLLFLFWFAPMGAFSADDLPGQPSAKVLAAFNQTFQSPDSVRWFTKSGECIAVFVQHNIRTIVKYDTDAHFLYSRRYYDEHHLPLNIQLKIREQYKGISISIVTEVIEGATVSYFINGEDNKHFFILESEENGEIRQVKRLERTE